MVEYVDGSVLAQMCTPDMRTPISYALAWPDRMETPCERLDLAKIGRLDFQAPDEDRFPALALAKAALAAGGARPAVLNAANEVRSEEHTSELQSLMRISYAVFCLKKKKDNKQQPAREQPNKSQTKNSQINHMRHYTKERT